MAELPQNPPSNTAPSSNWLFAGALALIAILAFIVGSKLAQNDRATYQVPSQVNGENTQVDTQDGDFEPPDGKGEIL